MKINVQMLDEMLFLWMKHLITLMNMKMFENSSKMDEFLIVKFL